MLVGNKLVWSYPQQTLVQVVDIAALSEDKKAKKGVFNSIFS